MSDWDAAAFSAAAGSAIMVCWCPDPVGGDLVSIG